MFSPKRINFIERAFDKVEKVTDRPPRVHFQDSRMFFVSSSRFASILKPKYYSLLLPPVRKSAIIPTCYQGTVPYKYRHKDSTKPQRSATVVQSSLGSGQTGHLLYFPVNLYSTVRENEQQEGINKNRDGYHLVYFINHLSKIRFISLFKVYQTLCVVGSLPFFFHAWMNGTISDEIFYNVGGIMVFSTIMLYVIAQYFTSIICAIYADEKGEKVMFSHLNFRTRRKDVILNVEDIQPLFDVNATKKDLYYNVKTYDKKHKFKLFLHYGTVHDQKMLAELLGKMM